MTSADKITNYIINKKSEDNKILKTSVKDKISSYNKTNTEDNKTHETEDKQTNNVVQKLKLSSEKTTKMTLPANSNVRKKIAKYQELSTKDECVIGGGMCAMHNVKVIRVLKPSRMSVINKDGSLGWRMSEKTTLA